MDVLSIVTHIIVIHWIFVCHSHLQPFIPTLSLCVESSADERHSRFNWSTHAIALICIALPPAVRSPIYTSWIPTASTPPPSSLPLNTSSSSLLKTKSPHKCHTRFAILNSFPPSSRPTFSAVRTRLRTGTSSWLWWPRWLWWRIFSATTFWPPSRRRSPVRFPPIHRSSRSWAQDNDLLTNDWFFES